MSEDYHRVFELQLFDKMFAANENSRMSRIADHNIYLNTDTLYEPLRNALRKSTVSSSFLSPQNYLADNRLSASRIARNMRSLSPAETEIIKKNIFIPVNKELVPTRNLQKVMGKQFTAVDMEEKVGEAISPEQFSRVKTGTVQEIVYQVKQDERSIYTHPPKYLAPQPIPKPPLASHLNFIQQRFQSPRIMQSAIKTPIFNIQNQSVSMINKNSSREYQTASIPTVTSRQYFKELPVGGNLSGSIANQRLSASSAREEIGAKAYGFKQSSASKQGSLLRLRKEREEYKYNLFSLIDEGGNTGCKNGCFGSNQICAPKITTNPWK